MIQRNGDEFLAVYRRIYCRKFMMLSNKRHITFTHALEMYFLYSVAWIAKFNLVLRAEWRCLF